MLDSTMNICGRHIQAIHIQLMGLTSRLSRRTISQGLVLIVTISGKCKRRSGNAAYGKDSIDGAAAWLGHNMLSCQDRMWFVVLTLGELASFFHLGGHLVRNCLCCCLLALCTHMHTEQI